MARRVGVEIPYRVLVEMPPEQATMHVAVMLARAIEKHDGVTYVPLDALALAAPADA